MKKTIGGHRLGAGQKMETDLNGYERSTHDLSYAWRSSQAPGTLVPFMVEVGLPGDTFDIDLDANVMTHPSLGPLFGSFKLQLDVFEAPVRLYHAALMQNTLNIGNNMAQVLLPQLSATVPQVTTPLPTADPNNIQINPSNILNYLGIRGWGWNEIGGAGVTRQFNAIPFLAYWEIYKNYYANKQENVGAQLVPPTPTPQLVTSITINAVAIPQAPATGSVATTTNLVITTTGTVDLTQIYLNVQLAGSGQTPTAIPITQLYTFTQAGLVYTSSFPTQLYAVLNWGYLNVNNLLQVATFPLANIDAIKTRILQQAPLTRLTVSSTDTAPYGPPIDNAKSTASQCGLGLKTYQSDLFNNWIQTSTFTNITTASNVSTAGNQFSIDSLNLAQKVYKLLNRIAISGGSYEDWMEAAYAHTPYSRCISPMYHGGLSKEIVFQQVISNSGTGNQPLGTLAGRGTMNDKHKGGKITIKVEEPTYIIGIVSITPRLDYSQGNKWFNTILTMDNYHKPALDQIGFQDLITEQMAWWDTKWNGGWIQNSAGKQPAWMNYMTAVNQTYGNFAIQNNEMFMTLNRRFQMNPNTRGIQDLTTYIDPSHYNFIWAQTNLDAQNFWTQIAVGITARRKMSAKIMPNL